MIFMRNDHLKQICQHPRLVDRLPRHFQGLIMPLSAHGDGSVSAAQSMIRKILAVTQGRIFVAPERVLNHNLHVAFEEPGDLVYFTLAMPALLSEKIQ